MTQLDDLRVLAEKVEAGKHSPGMDLILIFGHDHFHHAAAAMGGSLDAAKALHEAVLPGWAAHVWMWEGDDADAELTKAGSGIKLKVEVEGNNPARALLIAIIRAKIAMLEESDAS